MFLSDRPGLTGLRVKGDMIIRPETSNGKSLNPTLPPRLVGFISVRRSTHLVPTLGPIQSS